MFASSTLAALVVMYAVGLTRVWRNAGVGQGIARGQAVAFAAGWLTLVVALVALDDLSEQLFAAHMAQHELLMLVAAPLVAVGAPFIAFIWMLPGAIRRRLVAAVRRPSVLAFTGFVTAPAAVWLLHALALWIWHVPALYDAALRHESVHALQHVSFFGSAALFWWGIAHGRYGRTGYGAAVVYVFATAVHSGVLGALLTFSAHVWYPAYDAHAAAAARFGLTTLEDQQLAGLLMWIPAGVIFIVGGLYFFAAWIRESERRADLFAAR